MTRFLALLIFLVCSLSAKAQFSGPIPWPVPASGAVFTCTIPGAPANSDMHLCDHFFSLVLLGAQQTDCHMVETTGAWVYDTPNKDYDLVVKWSLDVSTCVSPYTGSTTIGYTNALACPPQPQLGSGLASLNSQVSSVDSNGIPTCYCPEGQWTTWMGTFTYPSVFDGFACTVNVLKYIKQLFGNHP